MQENNECIGKEHSWDDVIVKVGGKPLQGVKKIAIIGSRHGHLNTIAYQAGLDASIVVMNARHWGKTLLQEAIQNQLATIHTQDAAGKQVLIIGGGHIDAKTHAQIIDHLGSGTTITSIKILDDLRDKNKEILMQIKAPEAPMFEMTSYNADKGYSHIPSNRSIKRAQQRKDAKSKKNKSQNSLRR